MASETETKKVMTTRSLERGSERRLSYRQTPQVCDESSKLALAARITVFALPPLLYLTGFILMIRTISSPDYVRADQLTDPPPGDVTRFTNNTLHSSLWHICTLSDADPDNFVETCVSRPAYGAAGLAACEKHQFNHFSRICQKVVQAAELYLAAVILAGMAVGGSIAWAGLQALCSLPVPNEDGGCKGDERRTGQSATRVACLDVTRRISRRLPGGLVPSCRARVIILGVWQTVTSALALASAGCLVLGQILGVGALVVEGSVPMTKQGFVPNDQTRWYLSNGAGPLTTAGYVVLFSGAFLALSGCGLSSARLLRPRRLGSECSREDDETLTLVS